MPEREHDPRETYANWKAPDSAEDAEQAAANERVRVDLDMSAQRAMRELDTITESYDRNPDLRQGNTAGATRIRLESMREQINKLLG